MDRGNRNGTTGRQVHTPSYLVLWSLLHVAWVITCNVSTVSPRIPEPPARTPLQELVSTGIAKLGLTNRGAAARSQGLVSHQTIQRLAGTDRWAGRVTARTIAGLALALDLTESEVRAAAARSRAEEAFADHNRIFHSLDEVRRADLVAYLLKLWQEQEAAAAREKQAPKARRTSRPVARAKP